MKLSLIVSALSLIVLNNQTAKASPVNDTGTGIVARAGDCSVVSIQDAYFTFFGHQGALGKALIVKAQIRNDAYQKTVHMIHENGHSDLAENSPLASRVRIEYQGQIGNMDQVELTDRTIGRELSGLYRVTVTMLGQMSDCVFQIDRK
ncbi:hypothetical protein ACLVWU_02105 [Bdellovibrio sp. HCB290]|uniref:hypothetical protein n=1 Tax=Bdellovibrio sp. HCB290 TaxID=3394356 RepID=UPI0039B5E02E